MNTINKPLPSDRSWPRPYLISILEAALTAREYRFARKTSLAWLASFPGDLPVSLIRARALIADGTDGQALPVLESLVQIDPEYSEAQLILYRLRSRLKIKDDDIAHDCAIALGGSTKKMHTKKPDSEHWSHILAETRNMLSQGDIPSAEEQIQKILGVASHTALCGVTHINVLRQQPNTPRVSIQNLAEHYHKRWPECLQFQLVLAETMMDGGDAEQGVALLHKAAAHDVVGQVAKRLWGEVHPYRNLWAENLSAMISVQIPSSVSASMGWNLLPRPGRSRKEDVKTAVKAAVSKERLKKSAVKAKSSLKAPKKPAGKAASRLKGFKLFSRKKKLKKGKGKTRPKTQPRPEMLRSVKNELENVKKKRKQGNSEGRFPVYVVFTTQKGLHRKYGVETTKILDESMRKLVAALRKRLDWGSILVYADEPSSMAQYGLKPVPPDDPWKLKLALVDLDDALGKRGARIGALLIIGGPDVVPFHNLPNPTDDSDADVPSDNPYATRDENYFVPEWSVGRLPGGAGKDPGLLLSTLRTMIDRHSSTTIQSENRMTAIWNWIVGIFRTRKINTRSSFGYSAEVWKDVSGSIFRTIGDPRALFTSPPDEIHRKRTMPRTQLGYFNLHGVIDSGEWFGQRDPRNGSDGPEYPTALDPKDVINGGRAPKVIFSEACYGANILEKSIDDALALKFLDSGSQAMVGSTVISYGSVTQPLNAADLLGKAFWKYFKEGFPTGEALRRAKIAMATEMHDRQGYLDGEDQKTLISFVLYGDPLAQEKELFKKKPSKTFSRTSYPKEIKTVCDRVDIPGTSEPIPKDVIGNVKNIVEQYLPGMRGAQLCMNEYDDGYCEGHLCPTSQLGSKSSKVYPKNRRVVTLSKQMVRAKNLHESFARLTLDKEGKVVKLTVSR